MDGWKILRNQLKLHCTLKRDSPALQPNLQPLQLGKEKKPKPNRLYFLEAAIHVAMHLKWLVMPGWYLAK